MTVAKEVSPLLRTITLERDSMFTWTCSSVVEQMPAKGMVVGSSPTKSVGFPTDLFTINELNDCNQLINYMRKGKFCSLNIMFATVLIVKKWTHCKIGNQKYNFSASTLFLFSFYFWLYNVILVKV